MSDATWTDDACSLVDAFRAGERSPKEELQATLDAIEASDLNCFSFLDPERALAAAETADISKPFGGVPVGIKELDSVEGWPDTGASLVFKDRIATHNLNVTFVAFTRERSLACRTRVVSLRRSVAIAEGEVTSATGALVAKALGTFGYQTTGRRNPVYIQYIPRTLRYVRDNLERLPRFARIRELLAGHVEEFE